jgi:uncharacterized protein YoxC
MTSRPPKSTVRINIETAIKGMAFSLNVEEAASIKYVKELIKESEGIFVESQELLHNGKILANDKTLKDYKIQHDATLLLKCYLCSYSDTI